MWTSAHGFCHLINAYVCFSVCHMSVDAESGQKRVMDRLELELQEVRSRLTRVLWINVGPLEEQLSHFSSSISWPFFKKLCSDQQQLGSANPLLLFFLSWSTDPFALLGGLFSWVMSLIIEKSSLAKILLTLVRWSYLAYQNKIRQTNKQKPLVP